MSRLWRRRLRGSFDSLMRDGESLKKAQHRGHRGRSTEDTEKQDTPG
jgi:hypothetical protein